VEGPVFAGGIGDNFPHGPAWSTAPQLDGLNVQVTPLVGEMSLETVAFTVTAAAAASIAVNGFVIATAMFEVMVTLNIEFEAAGAKADENGF
jgi:hypothetical protein